MIYEIRVSAALPRPLAAVHHVVRSSEIPSVIQGLLGEVWQFLREQSVTSTGRNIAIYTGASDGQPDPLLDAVFGVEVHEVIPSSDRVVAAETPAGPLVSTVHWGRYDRLGEAHDAVQAWCRANGHRLSGTCWEVYGPWSDDWAKVRTEVIYLLEP